MLRVPLQLGLVWVLLTLVLAACGGEKGFHLRGTDPMAMTATKVALEGAAGTEFTQLVRVALQGRGATVTEAAQAQVIVTIQDPIESKRVSGYSSTRAVNALRHTTEANFSLKRVGSSETLASSVAQSQVQAYDSEYVLGTQEEADQIRANLRRDVARLLALKVVAFSK